MDGIIVVVKKGTKYFAYGVQNGLWKASQVRTANDNSGLVTVEYSSRADMEEDYSEYEFDLTTGLFNEITPQQFIEDYEMITGLSILDGDNFHAQTTGGCDFISLMPNSDFYNQEILNLTETGTGYFNLFIPKSANTTLDLSLSEIQGLFSTKSVHVDLSGCRFKAKEIEYILSRLVDFGGVDGEIDIPNGTNAAYSTWTDAAKAHKITLVGRGWTVINNA